MIKEGLNFLYETMQEEKEGIQAILYRRDQTFPFFALLGSADVITEYSDFGSLDDYDLIISAQLSEFTEEHPKNGEVIEIVDDQKYTVAKFKKKAYTIKLHLTKDI